MSTHPAPYDRPATMPAWAQLAIRREFWGGIVLATMWVAILFVGIFGGNIQTTGSGGSFPVVVIVAIVALLATISVGRWAFRPDHDR